MRNEFPNIDTVPLLQEANQYCFSWALRIQRAVKIDCVTQILLFLNHISSIHKSIKQAIHIA